MNRNQSPPASTVLGFSRNPVAVRMGVCALLALSGVRLGAQSDTTPPQVTGISFGNGTGFAVVSEGSTNRGVIDRWNVSFSEGMAPGTVNNTINFELRSAGA